ncbi:APC family permease [Actinomadura madurae]|uniref:APC family permease n=1 Tax=Actinomadura madurae TaxID=1993 RepID=UPI00202666F0|nr:APC family permease [Actinomadura madurae]URM96594.1 APC family permease [Actinomadura madurae]
MWLREKSASGAAGASVTPPGDGVAVDRGKLRGNTIGAGHIVFFVVSAAAPLSGIVLGVPVIVGQGNGTGAAGTFVLVTAVLLLFAVGYSAMSRHIVNAGGFYTYVAHGLGRIPGLGAATLALFAYTAIQAGMFGALGAYVDRFVQRYLGAGLPWWLYSLAGTALCLALGVRKVEVGARALGVMLLLESALIIVLDVAIFATGGASEGGPAGLSWEPFSPAAVFSGALGIALVFAYTSFIGFEATVIYGEEARDPRRTVPKATYIALIGMGVFYSISAWLLTNSFRADSVVAEAGDDPESFAAKALRSQLGAISNDIMSVLIITSIFAAVLAFHNTLARYLFALGRQGLVWGRLGRTHRTRQSPHVACLAQAATATAVIGVFAVSGADPYGGLYVWATGLGAIGVIILQSVASVAVFVFFRRRSADKRVWHTVLAPALSMLGLLGLAAVSLSNFGLLIGDPGAVATVGMAATLPCAALVGMGRAAWLRRRDPVKYARIGDLPDDTTSPARPG